MPNDKSFGPRIAAVWQALVEHLNHQTDLQTEEADCPHASENEGNE